MAEKQALNATFFAFRKREKSGVLFSATLTFAVLAVLVVGVFFALNAQGFADYMRWAMSLASMEAGKPGAPPSPEMMMPPASVIALAPAYLLFMIVYYVLLASYEAACLRWMIRGETGGLFGLTLGGDTWRIYFGYWLWLFLIMAFYIVFAIGAGGTIFALAAATQGGANAIGPGAVIVPVVLGLMLVCAITYFAVRFAPAAATSIARGKFAFFDAWKVTKNRFWALLGSFLLLFLIFMVICFVAAGAMGVTIGTMAAAHVGAAPEPKSPEDVFALFANPQLLITIGVMYGLMILASLIFYVALFGVNARAALAALEEGKIQAAG